MRLALPAHVQIECNGDGAFCFPEAHLFFLRQHACAIGACNATLFASDVGVSHLKTESFQVSFFIVAFCCTGFEDHCCHGRLVGM